MDIQKSQAEGQESLDRDQAVADLDQAVGDREQTVADTEQRRLDASRFETADGPPDSPRATVVRNLQRRDQDRRDAHQHQLDTTQGGRDERQTVLDEQQDEALALDATVDTPERVAREAVERALAARRRAEAALERAEAAYYRAELLHQRTTVQPQDDHPAAS